MTCFTGQLLWKGQVVADPVDGRFEVISPLGTKPTWYGDLDIPPDATIELTQISCQLRLSDGSIADIILDGPAPGRNVEFRGSGAPPESPPAWQV